MSGGPLTAVPVLGVDTGLTLDFFNEYIAKNMNYLIQAGADLTAVGASNTLTITNEFHIVTVAASWTVDTISTTSVVKGQQVKLLFQNSGTIRYLGGGTGNIKTTPGYDRGVSAGEIITLEYDGLYWWVANRQGIGVIYDSTSAGVSFPTASISVTIPQTYKHLLVMWQARSDNASTLDSLACVLNGSTSGYYWQRIVGRTSTMSASFAASQTHALAGIMTGASASGGYMGSGMALIPNYTANAAGYKILLGMSGTIDTLTSGQAEIDATVYFLSNGPVSTLTFKPENGTNLVAGTRITVYGV